MTDDYTLHVGEKFHADGMVRPYPGSTVICFTPADSALYAAGAQLQDALRARPYGDKFAFLPPSSFHMTVFSLICAERRVADEWTTHLPLDAALAETDALFLDTVPTVTPPATFQMVMTYLGGWGLNFRLSPADEYTDEALTTYRNQLSQATGVRYPDHSTYPFHMTLAYPLRYLSDAERADYYDWRMKEGAWLRQTLGVFNTGTPVLTFFDDMAAFVPADQRHTLASRAQA